jgi:hypothetical protein
LLNFFAFKKSNMSMEPFSINELGGLITVVAGAVATVLFALQKSSCTDIRCFGLACRRDPALIAAARDEGTAPPQRPSEPEPEPEPEARP